jgi:hypothetical protein
MYVKCYPSTTRQLSTSKQTCNKVVLDSNVPNRSQGLPCHFHLIIRFAYVAERLSIPSIRRDVRAEKHHCAVCL